jgi:hypothetical protein
MYSPGSIWYPTGHKDLKQEGKKPSPVWGSIYDQRKFYYTIFTS